MTPAFITVRSKSSRLPGKCFLPFGTGNVLQHIINRCKHYKLEPIVCTSVERSDDAIVKLAIDADVKLFRGNEVDKLRRWRDCCHHFQLDSFHTVDADDPFFDAEEIERSYLLLEEGYDVVCPTVRSSNGNASSGYSLTRSIVESVCELYPEGADTEMMWHYLEKAPDLKKIILPDLHGASDMLVRLTLDYEEDYWLLESVRKILGNNAARKDVEDLFKRNPDFFKINWFRNQEWKAGQESKRLRE